MLKHELKNVQLKRTKKIKINLANPQNTWSKSWGRDNPIEKKIKKKICRSILNQSNVER